MNQVSNLSLFLIGFGTVFFGLVCLILMCKLMSYIIQKSSATKEAASPVTNAAAPTPAPVPAPVAQEGPQEDMVYVEEIATENRQELIAAVTAAIAEMLGTDITSIRVLSFRQVD